MVTQIIDPKLIPFMNEPLPHDLEAERGLLRQMIQVTDRIDTVDSAIAGEMFFDSRHRKLFELILELRERNEPVNRTQIQLNLMRQKDEDAAYLMQLIADPFEQENPEDRAGILNKLLLRRQIILAGNQVILGAMDTTEEPKLTVDWADKVFVDMAFSGFQNVPEPVEIDLAEAFTEYPPRQSAIRTGFIELDKLLIGLEPASVIIVAGGVAAGKTALALALLQHVVLEENAAVYLCSPGSTRQKIAERLRLARVAIPADKASIWIDDSPRLTAVMLRQAGRRAKLQVDAKCVVVDDLHLLCDPQGGSRYEHWCHVAGILKMMATELQLPIMAFVQLDQRLGCSLDALMAFGSLGQHADAILLLHRPDHLHSTMRKDESSNRLDITVAKNRHGQTGMVKLALNPRTGSLATWSGAEKAEKEDRSGAPKR